MAKNGFRGKLPMKYKDDCVYCGVRLRSGHNKSRDHFHPRIVRDARGLVGPIYSCCLTCNQIKKDYQFEDVESARQFIYCEALKVVKGIKRMRENGGVHEKEK